MAGIVGSINGNKIEYATNDAKITNNKPSSVEVFNYTAGIVGYAESTTMYYVINNGKIEGDSDAAGIVCIGEYVDIEYAKNTGEILAKGNAKDTGLLNAVIVAGSIAASLSDSSVNIAYNTANIYNEGEIGFSGGIVGIIAKTSIRNTYTPNIRVEASYVAGGIVGSMTEVSYIDFSYSRSTYIGSNSAAYAGGIAGAGNESVITSCLFITVENIALKTAENGKKGLAFGISEYSTLQSFAYLGFNTTTNAIGSDVESYVGYIYKCKNGNGTMFSRDNKDFFTEGKITTEDGGTCTFGGSSVSVSEFGWYVLDEDVIGWDLNSIWTTTDTLFNLIAFKF